MLEALITLLVMSIGLLGMAALQLIGVQENASALRHSQATWFAYDMSDRMRANAEGIAATHYDGIDTNSLPASPNCKVSGANCSAQQIANLDANEWGAQIQQFPGGRGTVDLASGRYIIRVMWNDDVRTGVNTKGCPSGATVGTALTCVETTVEP